jgi:protein TonB
LDFVFMANQASSGNSIRWPNWVLAVVGLILIVGASSYFATRPTLSPSQNVDSIRTDKAVGSVSQRPAPPVVKPKSGDGSLDPGAPANVQVGKKLQAESRQEQSAGSFVPNKSLSSSEQTPHRIRQAGNVQAGLLCGGVAPPLYPPLARQTRVSGTVRLHAIVGEDGSIQSLEVVSGHPLLIQAALDAVKQWRYKPTVLNGTPVEVDTTIDVIFNLNQ